MRSRGLLQSPPVAAILSFILPGLGQAAAGSRRRGLVIAAPALALLVIAAGLVLFARHAIVDSLFSSSALFSFLLLDVAVLIYRLWAIADAFMVARARPSGTRIGRVATRAVIGIVVLATLGTHLAFGALDMAGSNALSSAFNPNGPGWFGDPNLAAGETAPAFTDQPDPTDLPTEAPSASPTSIGSPTPTPIGSPTVAPTPGPTTADGIPVFPIDANDPPNTPPTEWAADGKLNVLLVGADSGTGRWSLRTDTMILLEVDIATGRAAMYGIPRNLENVPLPPESADAFPCHCFPYPNLLNGLWRDAVNRPAAYQYPGTDFVRGFKALEGAVGELTGLHVDGVVLVNLMGFVNLVNALGGVDINVPVRLRDSQYSRPQDGKNITLDIKAGPQHMDGLTALAYARSRHQDSDYGRMARQQAVLLALRNDLHPCSLLPEDPFDHRRAGRHVLD